MRDFAAKFYKSQAWKTTRREYAKSVGGLCERCMAPGEIVHHKVHLTPENIQDPAVALSWDNLELLCRDCHGAAHGHTKRYSVDQYGRVEAK